MRRTPAIALLLGILTPLTAHGQLAVRLSTTTPPRLAAVEGQASFLRPGGSDWTAARVNTPLGIGDALATAGESSVEIQIGAASYLRLGAATYLELSDLAPDQLQLKLAGGEASLDLRDVAARTVEVDTPSAAFVIDRPGYYRLHADKRSATLIVRRGGGATVTPGNGPGESVRTGEEVVAASDGVHHYAAPDLDAWDRWSLARTDRLVDTLSARYVADGIYGVGELDQAGTWRTVEPYGPVWIPDAVPAGWAPFSAGVWLYDAAYGWSWVDDMPWGWAPFHHGRWVSVDGVWAWAPGPPDVVPAYLPATVGWLESGAGIAWVPLAFGEPVFPWWGSPGTTGVASWAGWGGPWFVNGAPIQQRIAVYARNMKYANATVPGAVGASRPDRFQRGARDGQRATAGDAALMQPRDAGPGVSPLAASLAPTTDRGPQPGGSLTGQRVVATKMPPDAGARLRAFGLKVPGTAVVQLVLPPPRTMLSTGDRPPEAVASGRAPQREPERAGAGDTERVRSRRAPGFLEWLSGVEALEAAGQQVPRDLFEAPGSSQAYAWRSNRGFEPPMGEAYRTDLPGEPGMRLRPYGGAGGFALAEGERAAAPMTLAQARPRPVPVPAVAPATTTTPSLPTTTLEAPPPTIVTTTSLAPLPTIVTTTTQVPPEVVVTTTTLAPLPAIVSAPQTFQSCTGVGATCGPCMPSGEMAVCLRQIGNLSPVCALPNTCVVMSCLWDSDCGSGRRCVQNPDTMQTNCCEECAGVVGEARPRYVTLSTIPPSATTTTPAGQPLPPPSTIPTYTPTTTSVPPPTFAPTTTLPAAAPAAAGTFQSCTAAGEACGPCPPSDRMSTCLRHIGDQTLICTQPDACVATSCLWDRDCGPGRRCVLNAATLQTNCCEECTGLGHDNLFDAGPSTTSTTSTLPPAPAAEGGTVRGCGLPGDPCGPCGTSGLMSMCRQEIGSTRVLCPKIGACVDITCARSADCLPTQRCVFNPVKQQSSCCEVCE